MPGSLSGVYFLGLQGGRVGLPKTEHNNNNSHNHNHNNHIYNNNDDDDDDDNNNTIHTINVHDDQLGVTNNYAVACGLML